MKKRKVLTSWFSFGTWPILFCCTWRSNEILHAFTTKAGSFHSEPRCYTNRPQVLKIYEWHKRIHGKTQIPAAQIVTRPSAASRNTLVFGWCGISSPKNPEMKEQSLSNVRNCLSVCQESILLSMKTEVIRCSETFVTTPHDYVASYDHKILTFTAVETPNLIKYYAFCLAVGSRKLRSTSNEVSEPKMVGWKGKRDTEVDLRPIYFSITSSTPF